MPGDCEPAADRDVRLQDMHSALNEIFESPPRDFSLARRNWNRRRSAELTVALHIVLGERFFEPADIELLEQSGALPAAAVAAKAATAEEPTNWRTWLVLARIDGKRGAASAAVAAIREARALNPRSPLLGAR